MKKILAVLHTHDPKTLFVLAIASLGLAYIVVSRAIDTGSLLQYLIFFLLVIYSFRFAHRGMNSLIRHGKKR